MEEGEKTNRGRKVWAAAAAQRHSPRSATPSSMNCMSAVVSGDWKTRGESERPVHTRSHLALAPPSPLETFSTDPKRRETAASTTRWRGSTSLSLLAAETLRLLQGHRGQYITGPEDKTTASIMLLAFSTVNHNKIVIKRILGSKYFSAMFYLFISRLLLKEPNLFYLRFNYFRKSSL